MRGCKEHSNAIVGPDSLSDHHKKAVVDKEFVL
jgi:hypothetical protein